MKDFRDFPVIDTFLWIVGVVLALCVLAWIILGFVM